MLNMIFITFTTMYFLCMTVLTELFRPLLMTLSIIVCLFASGGICYFLTIKRGKSGIALVSAQSGCILIALLSTAIQLRFAWLLHIFMVVAAVAFYFLSFRSPDITMIWSTSLTGSFYLVRSISLLIGSYPNELSTPSQLSVGAIQHVELSFYVYLFFIVIITILSSYHQMKKAG